MNWRQQNNHRENQVPRNQEHERSNKRGYNENKGHHESTHRSSNQRPSKSSIQVTSIDPKVNKQRSEMDLNIERRPLSPINKIDPRNSKKVSSTIKTYVPQTSNKPLGITEPSIVKSKQQEPNALEGKLTKRPSPIVEPELFEKINEAELPTIGDTSNSGTPQSQILNQNLTSDQEESTLDPCQSGLVEEVTHTNTSTQVESIGESTREESQSALLGENLSSASESTIIPLSL